MARKAMVTRTVRVPGDEWQDALDVAAERGENFPDELRAFIRRYIAKQRKTSKTEVAA